MYLHIYLKCPLLYLAKRGNSVRKNSKKPMYIYFEFSPLNFVTKIQKNFFCSISTLIFIYTLAMNKSLQKSFYSHIFSNILLFSSLSIQLSICLWKSMLSLWRCKIQHFFYRFQLDRWKKIVIYKLSGDKFNMEVLHLADKEMNFKKSRS